MHLAFLRTARASIPYCGLVGFSLLSASCGGGGDGSTAPPPTIGSIVISPSNPAPIPAGGTLQLSATVRDTRGQPLSGQAITYATSAPSIATVSGQGLVSAPGPVGAVDITASAGSVSASVSTTIVAGASASLTRTSADPANVSAGAPAGDSVRYLVTDAFGNPRRNEIITFTVAAGDGQVSPALAETDPQGRAATRFRTGTTAGQNTLTATVGGVAPISFSLTTVPSAVSISSVTPSPMTAGATVTINGTGFSPVTTEDAVTIDGQAATITSASSIQLTVVVPTTLPCAPTHQADLEVIVNGAPGFARPMLRPGTLRSVAVGSALVIGDPAELGCTELSPASGSYTVSVLNTSAAPSLLTPFRFSGTTTIPASASLAVNAFVLRQSMSTPFPRRPATAMESEARTRALAHTRVLEANRAIYRKFRSRVRVRGRTAASASPSLRPSVGVAPSVSVPMAVGDTRTFRVIQFSVGGGATCSSFAEITARVVHVGAKSIIYEDAAAPLAGQMDSYFVRLGEEFDATMYASDSTYFGDPLVTDPDTDADQHLNMVFTPSVPTGLSGFVITCDFFARNETDNQGSNLGENFYARVPTVAGTGFSENTADSWLRQMRAVVVHEAKHIAAFGARLVSGALAFEESWLEEGMAMTAEEVWARNAVYLTTWKGNADYASTLYCEVRPNDAACSGKPYVMFDHFDWLYDFLDQAGSHSLFGGVASLDFTFYGTAWSFIRWNADRYASSEVSFLRGITQAVDVVGLANITRQAGSNPEQMLAMWSLSLSLDENTAVAGNPDLGLPTWNLRDIYRGMSADFPTTFPKTYPLVAQPIPSGNFSIDNAGIHGGSFALYDLFGVSGDTRAVSLIPNTAPNPGLRLVIARVQ